MTRTGALQRRLRLGACLAAAGLAGAGTAVASADAPWIIAEPTVVTAAVEHVGDIVVVSGGRLELDGVPQPGFRLTGNLLVAGTGEVVMRSSVVRIMSAYNGQFFVAAGDQGLVSISSCDYRVPNGVQHGIIAAGAGTVSIADTDFDFVQFLVAEGGTLTAERLTGEFEVLLQEAGTLTLRDIPRVPGAGVLWVWPEFPAGSKAVYTPPMPGYVESWSFPPPGATGFSQHCVMERCEARLWPFLVRAGSDLTVRDVPEGNWVVIGLHMPNDAVVDGLVNGLTYAEHDAGFADRRLVLENASVDTWNFYPQAEATVLFRDCLLGEILAMESSKVTLERTTIDGSGGYFGVEGSAVVEATDSVFTCTVQVSDGGTATLRRSRLLPYPVDTTGQYTRFGAHDDGRLLLDTSQATSTPVIGGSGLIAVAGVLDPPAAPPGPALSLDLLGWAALYTLDPGLLPLRWRLEAATTGTGSEVLGSGEGNVEGGPLGRWTGSDPRRVWELRIVLRDGRGRELVSRTQVPAAGLARRRLSGAR